jgi:DNA repair exonuclease SbcCD ATPase subunit
VGAGLFKTQQNRKCACMALEDLEVNVGGTSIKGVWIAIVLTFGSTIGGGIWGASQFFSQLNEQSEAVIQATAQAEALAQRFDDLRKTNTDRLQGMDIKLSNMEQAMTAADVENLQGKLSELGANLMQIMDAQKELLDIRDRISNVEKTSGESEIKVNAKLESLSNLDKRLQKFERDMDDLWMAIDATNPLGGN